MEYSGKTTAFEHKHGDWKNSKGAGEDCIKQVTVFDVQWSNCPEEVESEVRKLWMDMCFGNDHYYFEWDEECSEDYPVINEYLTSRGVKKCLIHWWW